MTLNLELTPELEERLRQEASRCGLSIDQYTLKILEQNMPVESHQQQAVDLLQSWIDQGDAEEQKDTGEYLIRALDEDRLSDRKLFPENLKGITW